MAAQIGRDWPVIHPLGGGELGQDGGTGALMKEVSRHLGTASSWV
jgi:hypothetical protein